MLVEEMEIENKRLKGLLNHSAAVVYNLIVLRNLKGKVAKKMRRAQWKEAKNFIKLYDSKLLITLNLKL